MKKQNYFKNSWNLFVKSFKDFDTRAIFIVLYDLIFFSIIYLSFIIFSKYIQNKSLKINIPLTEEIMQLPQTEISQISSQLNNFLWFIFIGIVLVALIIFIAACTFKGLIWLKITHKKFTIDFIKKFVLLNLIWTLIWIIPIIIIALVLKKDLLAPFLVIIAPLIMHFTNILHIFFIHTKKLSSIKRAFKIGIKKIYLFILPYILMLIIFLIISQSYWLYNFMPGNIPFIIAIFVLLVYFAWFRIYLYTIVKDIEKI